VVPGRQVRITTWDIEKTHGDNGWTVQLSIHGKPYASATDLDAENALESVLAQAARRLSLFETAARLLGSVSDFNL
jgi:hypothetical protein